MATIDTLTYGKVVGRFAVAVGDGTDNDLNPDVEPMAGRITFTLTADDLKVRDAQPVPVTVIAAGVDAVLDDEGYMTRNGERSIRPVATEDPSVNPVGSTYKVTFHLSYKGTSFPKDPIYITVPAYLGEDTDTVVDLTEVAPVSEANGVPIVRGPVGPSGDMTAEMLELAEQVRADAEAVSDLIDGTEPAGLSGETRNLLSNEIGAAVSMKIDNAARGAAEGVATLDESGIVPEAQLHPRLSAFSQAAAIAAATADKLDASKRGQVNGVGSLDGAGLQPESQVPARLTADALAATFVPRWAPLTAYALGAKVVSPSGITVTAKAAFTSGAAYAAANWDQPADLAAKANASDVYTKSATDAAVAAGVKPAIDGLAGIPGQVSSQVASQVPPIVATAMAADGTVAAAAASAVAGKLGEAGVVVTTDARLAQPGGVDEALTDAWVNAADQVVFGLDVPRGVVVAPIVESKKTITDELISPSVNGVTEEQVSTVASGLLYGIMDQNDLLWEPTLVDQDGRTPQWVLDNMRARMGIPSPGDASVYTPTYGPATAHKVVSGPDVAGHGHSMLAGAGGAGVSVLTALAADTGLTCRNYSVGGESSRGIVARQGGNPLLLRFEGGAIPASGPVNVTWTIDGGGGNSVWPLTQGTGTGTSTITGFVQGIPGSAPVHGTLGWIRDPNAPQYTHSALDVYTFTRTTPGTAVPAARPAAFMYDAALARRSDIHLYWIGRNNYSETERVFADQKAAIQHQSPLSKRFIILAECNGAGEGTGTGQYTNINLLNDKMRNEYARRFIDVRRYLIDYGLADAGITPTAQDTADIAADIVPTSLRSDGLHLNAAGYTIIGKLVALRMRELGWIA